MGPFSCFFAFSGLVWVKKKDVDERRHIPIVHRDILTWQLLICLIPNMFGSRIILSGKACALHTVLEQHFWSKNCFLKKGELVNLNFRANIIKMFTFDFHEIFKKLYFKNGYLKTDKTLNFHAKIRKFNFLFLKS